jgi:hypothetical protein
VADRLGYFYTPFRQPVDADSAARPTARCAMTTLNPLIVQLLASRIVTADDGQAYPLQYNISLEEGTLLQRVITEIKPTVTLEVGMAYAISTLFICDALMDIGGSAHHHAIDPLQREHYRDIGVSHIRQGGYAAMITLHREGSEFA